MSTRDRLGEEREHLERCERREVNERRMLWKLSRPADRVHQLAF